MRARGVLLIFTFHLQLLLVCCQGWGGAWGWGQEFVETEERLRRDLLSNYSASVRPLKTTYLYLSIAATSLNSLNIASQSVSFSIVLFAIWHDWRLMWNASDYGGLSFVAINPEKIWTPPLIIQNSVNKVGVIGENHMDVALARMLSSGVVEWSPPTEVTVSCEMTIAFYPFDTQTCSVIIIGWTHPVNEMDLVTGFIDIGEFAPHGEFELRNYTSYTIVIGELEPYTYKKVVFQFTFRRRWQFYGQNLLMPIVLNSILMNAVFLLPIESGEKLGYSLTVLLSYIVFLTWVTENLPPVSTDTSILQVYLAVVLCLGCLATLLTTWVLHLYHQPSDRPLSRGYLLLATKVLLPLRDCFCFGRRWRGQKAGDQYGDDHQRGTQKVSTVFPTDNNTRAGETTARRRHQEFGTLTVQEADSLPAKDARPPSLGPDRKGERGFRNEAWNDSASPDQQSAVITWQEFAMLLDYFLFRIFATLLIVLTTVIFAQLYVNY